MRSKSQPRGGRVRVRMDWPSHPQCQRPGVATRHSSGYASLEPVRWCMKDFCGVGARNCEQEEEDGGLAHYQTHHHGPLLTVASTSADAVKQLPNMLH